ncbi:Tetratricopeptide repeat-containing protein [Lachnospiraceae bacterium RM5]|nr:Tetratricopeptide repeat-containing protein [Lachnospiraceae bacterium RM5]
MYCYKCGSFLNGSDMCNSCGAKVRVYKKVLQLSNSYYNMGLVKAKNRDLTGASEYLNRSLKLNKRNTDARNLLGLVYFEMGEVVQAFKEWIISDNLQPDDNIATKYIKKLQSNQTKLNTINQTLKKYNVALNYAKNGDDDVAIIQLKKILNINPHLVKGHLLLALIYMKKGNYERAKKPITKVLKIDTNNPLAKRYLIELNTATELKITDTNLNKNKQNVFRDYEKEQIEKEIRSGYDINIPDKQEKTYFNSNSYIFTIINIFVGIAVGVIATYFLIMPARVGEINAKHNKEMLKLDSRIESLNNDNRTLEDQVSSITSERDNLSGQLENKGTESSQILGDYDNLLAAMKAFNSKDYVNAAIDISKIVDANRSQAFTELYQSIQPEAYKQAATAYYNNGVNQAKSAGNVDKLNTAISNLTEVFKYDYQSVDYATAANYLGEVYEKRYDITIGADVATAAAYKEEALNNMASLINNVLSQDSGKNSKAIENLQNHINSLTAK